MQVDALVEFMKLTLGRHTLDQPPFVKVAVGGNTVILF